MTAVKYPGANQTAFLKTKTWLVLRGLAKSGSRKLLFAIDTVLYSCHISS
jgi:hypothetical protein